jgi:signal transduction histidine kinase
MSMASDSIQRRLIAAVIVSQALLAAGLLFTGVFYTHRRLLSALEAGMQARAMSVAALVRYSEDASGNVYFDNTLMPGSVDPGHPDLFAVWTERSGLLVRSSNWPTGLELSPYGPDDRWNFVWDKVPYRALRVTHVPVLDREEGRSFRPQTLTIVYAAPTSLTRHQTWLAAEIIALASLLLLAATVSLALWGIRRGLLPLQHLAGQAALVSANRWQLHLPEEVQRIAELRPLTESMTTMLARLQRAFAQQREFLGSAAHELKTPVAVLKSSLQSLQQRPRSSEEYRRGLQECLEDLDRLELLLQWMLRLARAEQWAQGTVRRDLQVINLTSTCEEAVERIRPLAQTRSTAIHISSQGPVPFRADPEDLQLVWTNLLENAVRYSPAGSSVEVAVTRNNGGPARVIFEDHGPGIPAEDLPHVFERFYRGDPSRTRATGGFGLGLAIAKALVEAYGGTITAESTLGRGTRMTIELPISGE